MKDIIKCILIIGGLFISCVTQAQDYDPLNPVPPSPNAASIQKYGNTNVSLYTGAAQVDIPIYTVTDKDLKLPISLNYSGSGGIKVQEVASWVGIGWSLNAGGAITRVINGIADDLNVNGFTDSPAIPDFEVGTVNEFKEMSNGTKDGEPDMFYYNANGLSGQFVVKKGGEVFQMPVTENLITVYTDATFNPASEYVGGTDIKAFKIVDTKGIVYYFEAIEETRNRSVSRFSWSGINYHATSWYLTKVANANNTSEINLNYTPYSYVHYTEQANHIYKLPQGFIQNYSMSEINGQRLTSITSSQYIVNFIATKERCDLVNDNYLEAIEIRTVANDLVKKYKFDYSYFGSAGTVPVSAACNTFSVPGTSFTDGDYNLRLKLDQIQELGNDLSTTKPPYAFTYYNTQYLPSKYSYGRDHWGYYNGKTNNTSLEPKYATYYFKYDGSIVFETFGSADRNASEEYMRAGMLTSISYPTGGVTKFEYEPHEAVGEINFYDIVYDYELANMSSPYVLSSPWTVYNNINQDIEIRADFTQETSFYCQLNVTIEDLNGNVVQNINFQNGHENQTFALPIGQYRSKFSWSSSNQCNGDWGGFINLDLIWKNYTATRNFDIGGLRIGSIKDYLMDGTLANTKTYEYLNGTDPSGHLITIPKYGFQREVFFTGDQNTMSGWVRTYNSNVPLATTKGATVGYSNVTEYWGSQGNNMGKTEYTFTSSEDFPDVTRGWTFEEFDDLRNVSGIPNTYTSWIFPKTYSQDWRRGLLLSKVDFRADQGNYYKVLRTESEFKHYTPNNSEVTNWNPPTYPPNAQEGLDYIKGVVSNFEAINLSIGSVSGQNIISSDIKYVKFYNYFSGRVNLDKKTVTRFDDTENPTLTTTSSYFYENNKHHQVTKISTFDSKGVLRESILKYPEDYLSPSVALQKMVERNQIAQLIEQHEFVDGQVKNASADKYAYDATNANIIMAEKLIHDIGEVFQSSSDGSTFVGYDPVASVTYDSEARVVSVTARNGVTTSYIWENDLPIVKGEGITYPNLLSAYNASLGINYETDLRTHVLTSDGLITTYAFDNLRRMVEMFNADGQKQSYVYDAFGRLKNAKDNNGDLLKENEYHYANGN